MNQSEARIRSLIAQWRKMTEASSYGVAATMEPEVGRAWVIASTIAYKNCADELEQILNEESQ